MIRLLLTVCFLAGCALFAVSRSMKRVELGNNLTKVSLFLLSIYSIMETILSIRSLEVFRGFWNKIPCAIVFFCTAYFLAMFILSLAGEFDRDEESK